MLTVRPPLRRLRQERVHFFESQLSIERYIHCFETKSDSENLPQGLILVY